MINDAVVRTSHITPLRGGGAARDQAVVPRGRRLIRRGVAHVVAVPATRFTRLQATGDLGPVSHFCGSCINREPDGTLTLWSSLGRQRT